MNELTVKTVVLEPAKVEFNFDELSAVLDKQLEKYDGLEFTEEQATECRKVITELNKGKKALNDYRISTKKELSVSITDFEARCKHLSNKFDDVINPLKAQADEFEENRRNEKRHDIEILTIELCEKYEVDKNIKLDFDNKWLNKSTSMKSIEEDIITQIEQIKLQIEKEESDKEIIKMTVEIANERYGVDLLESTYIRLLDHEDLNVIKKIIMEDAQDELDEKLEKKDVVLVEKVHPEEVYIEQSKNDEEFIEIYKVTATESQLDALEEFMDSQDIKWKVIEEDD